MSRLLPQIYEGLNEIIFKSIKVLHFVVEEVSLGLEYCLDRKSYFKTSLLALESCNEHFSRVFLSVL